MAAENKVTVPQSRPLEEEEKEVLRAERDRVAAEAREAAAKARTAEIALEREEEKRRREVLADDYFHHRYHFDGQVSSASVEACIKQLKWWDRENPTCDIEISFSSPGGSVVDGMELFDYISMLRGEGQHRIVTSAYGMAASMAGILLQAGDWRVCGKQAYILIHEISFGAGGKFGVVEDEVKFVKKIQNRVLDIFAERCAAAESAVDSSRSWMPRPEGEKQMPPSRLTRKALAAGWNRTDWWIDADEALKFGLIDEVRG